MLGIFSTLSVSTNIFTNKFIKGNLCISVRYVSIKTIRLKYTFYHLHVTWDFGFAYCV